VVLRIVLLIVLREIRTVHRDVIDIKLAIDLVSSYVGSVLGAS
jgi:hypothetical protein